MSMLAEPKKRQKISANPNGNSWSADTSKFGQKLLEKMGWQKGKGLGLKESGDTSHVKVKMNMENRGLGCTKKDTDNWIAHQDDFSSLLAQLNDEHGAAAVGNDADKASAPAPSEAKSLFSKSKSSRKRVHYEKFTKGKDVSRYGGKSLDQIFGRRAASMLASSHGAAALPSASNSGNGSEQNSDEGSSGPTELSTRADHDPAQGSNMVASSLNVADYFAKKMAARKQALASASVNNKRLRSDEEDADAGSSRGLGATHQNPVGGDGRAVPATGYGCWDANSGNPDDGDGEHHPEKKKKRKKEKKKRRRAAEAEEADETEEAEH